MNGAAAAGFRGGLRLAPARPEPGAAAGRFPVRAAAPGAGAARGRAAGGAGEARTMRAVPPSSTSNVLPPLPAGATAGAATGRALRRLDRLAHLMDGAFRLPGTRWRFGLDGLLGFVPGAGDSVTALVSLYVLVEAWRLGAPPGLVLRMLGNVGLDWAVGSVPLVGDFFDLAFKANRRNLDLLRRHLDPAASARLVNPPPPSPARR